MWANPIRNLRWFRSKRAKECSMRLKCPLNCVMLRLPGTGPAVTLAKYCAVRSIWWTRISTELISTVCSLRRLIRRLDSGLISLITNTVPMGLPTFGADSSFRRTSARGATAVRPITVRTGFQHGRRPVPMQVLRLQSLTTMDTGFTITIRRRSNLPSRAK